MKNQEKAEKPNENDLKVREEAFLKEFKELEKKHKVSLVINLNLPEYRILPEDIKLALLVIGKHKTEFVLSCKEE